VRARSVVGAKYDATVNRESAYEVLNQRVAEATAPADAPAGKAPAPAGKPVEKPRSKMDDFLWGNKRRQGVVEAAAKSATRSVASGLGRTIVRGVLGSIFGGRKR
jgi:hypothetical protein